VAAHTETWRRDVFEGKKKEPWWLSSLLSHVYWALYYSV
jgi:hypothetical protein